MKPAPFSYVRPETVEDVLISLAEYGSVARVLAGGQSLIPMLHMRLIQPSVLVDVNRLEGLGRVESCGDGLVIGALTRYSVIEHSPVVLKRLPLLHAMIRRVGDRQVRNRGTIGGSLAHADPVSEVVLACLVLDASVVVRSTSGTRKIRIKDLVLGPYTTSLEPDELLVEVVFPASPSMYRFIEVGRRHNDFAMVSLALAGEPRGGGLFGDLRLGIAGGNDHPFVIDLGDTQCDSDGIAAAVSATLDAIDPLSDIRASADYKRHLIGVHLRRMLKELM